MHASSTGNKQCCRGYDTHRVVAVPTTSMRAMETTLVRAFPRLWRTPAPTRGPLLVNRHRQHISSLTATRARSRRRRGSNRRSSRRQRGSHSRSSRRHQIQPTQPAAASSELSWICLRNCVAGALKSASRCQQAMIGRAADTPGCIEVRIRSCHWFSISY